MKELYFNGKSIDDALANAARELGKDATELEYEVVEEGKKGFLGLGSADARILVRFDPDVKEATRDFLETLLKNAGIEAQINCEEKENGELFYTLEGDHLGVLIGRHGEVLDALQYLLSLVTNRHGDDYVRVSIDIENYREKRADTLRSLAQKTAQRVKRTGRAVTLEPMSPYERRIIHSQAQEIEGVTTHSIGSGDDRRVVMSPDGIAAAPRKKESAPQKDEADKPKVVYEYNPVREPRKIVKAKSIDDIDLADVEDTETVHL